MAEDNRQAEPGKVDMSKIALDLAKETGFFCGDVDRFQKWEKEFIKKFYETIGLSDIPDEFLNWTKFADAYAGVLVKSVQTDLALMNMTKRLSMYKLSENIQATAATPIVTDEIPAPAKDPDAVKPEGGVMPAFVPPTAENK